MKPKIEPERWTERPIENAGPGVTERHHFGENLKRMRLIHNLTIRELAAKVGVNKETVFRIEHGQTPSRKTMETLAKFFGVSASLTDQTVVSYGLYAVQRDSQAQWRAYLTLGSNVPIDLERIQDEQERLRLGRLGFIARFEQLYPGHAVLEGARCGHGAVMEIWRRKGIPATHAGFETCHCVRGAVRVFVGNETFELHEGDSAIFRSSEPHDYEPLTPLKPNDLPPLVLYNKVLN